MHVLIVIPARLESSRLPHKPLCLLNGEPLVHRLTRQALALRLDATIVVASEDRRVLDAVAGLNVRAVLTSSEHRSGTERVGEVIEMNEFADVDRLVNLQCDMVSVSSPAISGSLGCLDRGFSIGTVAVPVDSPSIEERDQVNVRVGKHGEAVSFARDSGTSRGDLNILRHVGVYAYTRQGLRQWLSLPECVEERVQQLEQLRPLRHGMPIGVAVLDQPAPITIDTGDDLRRARLALESTYGIRSRMSA